MQHIDLTPTLASTLSRIAVAATTARIVADSGTSVFHADDGTDTIIGGPTGQVTPFVGDTTPPPVPSAPTVSSASGSVFITWDGGFAGGADQPADFAFVTAYVDGNARAHFFKAGTAAIGDLTAGATVTVTLTASDDAHDSTGAATPNESAATAGVTVTVAAAVTTVEVNDIRADLQAASKAVDSLSQTVTAQDQKILDTQKAADDASFAAAQAVTDASSAVVLRVDSSRGLVFKNSLITTDLTVTVFARGQTITDILSLHEVFGAGAYLEWSWKRLDDSDFGVLSSADTRITQGGFRLSVSPADVDTKVVFMCSLNT